MAMTIEQFGQTIKKKYPQYQNVSDAELGNKMLEKYPQYKSQIATGDSGTTQAPNSEPTKSKGSGIFSFLGNAGKKIGEFGVGFAKGAASLPQEAASLGTDIMDRFAQTGVGQKLQKGVQSVARDVLSEDSLKSVAQGAKEIKTGMEQGIEKTEQQFAPDTSAEKAGFTAEKIAEFFVPVGAATKAKVAGDIAELAGKSPKLAKAVGAFTKVATEGVEQGVRSAVQKGTLEDYGQDFAAGAAIPVVGGALKLAGKAASGVAKTLASKLSGVPTAAIEEAFSNPNVVQGAIRQMAKDPDLGPQAIVQNAEDALKALKDARRIGYQNALEEVQKTGVNQKLSLDGVKKTAKEAFEKFNVGFDGQKVSFTPKTTLPKSYVQDLQEIADRINEWDDLTPTGLDDLREVVDSYYLSSINPSKADKQFNSIIQNIRKNVSDYVGSVSPEIKAMNEKYAKETQFIEAIRRELSLGKDKPVTAMRKLMNVFNSKSEVYRPILEQLDDQAGKQLKADIAGLIMSKWTPEGLGAYLTTALGGAGGLAAFLNPMTALATAPTLAVSSPRIVGEAATSLGKAAKSSVTKGASKVIKPLIKGAAAQSTKN